ncbi:MAG: right-handed parallel beta-helix repeat-containing protein [Candidatus Neomarinimicrobiota bacterium]
MTRRHRVVFGLLAVMSGLGVLMVSCDNPFMPELSKDEDFFELDHDFEGGPRILNDVPITLTWTEVTIPDFKSFTVYRTAVGSAKEYWVVRREIVNPLVVSYTDTIDDDETFQYKVRIEDNSGNYREVETDLIKLRTTHIVVPDEYQALQEAYNTPFIDDGDTIYVNPGTYVHPFKFLGKDVFIRSVAGREETVLKRGGTVFSMNRGVLSGFTITRGSVDLHGTARLEDCLITGIYTFDISLGDGYNERSAVTVRDSAELRNCVIEDNTKRPFWGEGGGNGGGVSIHDRARLRNSRITNNWSGNRGGGLSIHGEPTLTNCIIDNNYALNGGGGILVDATSSPTIVNCVIVGNESGLHNDQWSQARGKGNIYIMNSIVGKGGTYRYGGGEGVLWRNASYSAIAGETEGMGNIDTLHPRFVDFSGADFHLKDDSPCIDTGNPAPEYNDPDGSSNDMGAYGGLFGDAW